MLTIILIHVQRGRALGIRPRFFVFLSCFRHKKRATDESRTRDLFLTKEALYHWATAACFFRTLTFWVPFSFRSGAGVSAASRFLERKTGLEPATYSLEGYCSTKWATSASLKFGISWGRVDSNHRTLPRTDLQSVAIAAMRLPQLDAPSWISLECPSRWRDSNPRQADYKSATLPTELHRHFSTFQTTLFSSIEVAKILLFSYPAKDFFIFFHKLSTNCWFS